MVKEEDRLATTIEAIDYDVRIVPRSAYCRTALGTVEVNRSFEGWSLSKFDLIDEGKQDSGT